jgi:5-methylcytosine-specific restriction endonuclease McrA
MSCEKIHVAWLLQGWLTWIFDTQTGRLVRVGVCKRYAQPVNQRAAVCHLTSSSNGPRRSNPGFARCETLRQKQLDIPMRHHCCTSCVNDLRSGIFLTKGTHKLTVRILTKNLIHHNNSWNSDQLYDCMEVTLIPHNGWRRLLLHHITLESERDIIPRCGKHPNLRGQSGKHDGRHLHIPGLQLG